MSIGIGAHANLVFEDEQTVIYEYGGYNLDDSKYRKARCYRSRNGSILIMY